MLKLRNGVRPAEAGRRIRDLGQRGRNIATSSAGTDVARHQNDYLAWVSEAESHLRNVFTDPGTWTDLYTDAHWHARRVGATSPRWSELINNEIENQAGRLDGLANRLNDFAELLSRAPGTFVVVDTNVLLHGLLPEQVDWGSVAAVKPIRLVLPLRVVDELDEKKWARRPDLADRARRLLSQLWVQVGPEAGAPVQLSDSVTVEVPRDDEERRRNIDADFEILDLCRAFRGAAADVILVSFDTGMLLRGAARGLRVVQMPAKYLRKPTTGEPGSTGS